MTALLEDRVALWLSDHPNSSCEDVARGVSARRSKVRETLSGPLFTFNIVGSRVLYKLRSSARDWTGRAHKETDADFLLRVLSDGRPHNLNEILRRSFADRGCGLTAHSRAADLRKRGHVITNWKDGERGAGSWYQLGSLEDVASSSGGGRDAQPSLLSQQTDAASSSDPGGTDGLLRARPTSEQDAGIAQLSLTGPAFRRSAAA